MPITFIIKINVYVNMHCNISNYNCSAPRSGKPWLQFKQSAANGDSNAATFGNIVSLFEAIIGEAIDVTMTPNAYYSIDFNNKFY